MHDTSIVKFWYRDISNYRQYRPALVQIRKSCPLTQTLIGQMTIDLFKHNASVGQTCRFEIFKADSTAWESVPKHLQLYHRNRLDGSVAYDRIAH